MSSVIHVHLLPELAPEEALAGSTTVVIDVLRATTTIVHMLAAGADHVVPCISIEDAKEKGAAIEGAILGGERGGVRIDGFDLGNSPSEYSPDVVGGHTIVFTTTNGTKAMQRCQRAGRILIGAFVNLTAVCRELSGAEQVHLVCAGTAGEVTREDVLLAGAIVDLMGTTSDWQLNDAAQIALDAWRAAQEDLVAVPLVERLQKSRGGRNVLAIGLENDIQIAATLDKFDLVPELDAKTWEIRLR
ncbi:2-phosphosulfolactate phosphatase [Blastopirellula retiformator]|uniref:Probable 2-phosphosulfolactate phosphatase n=1 Tax=Blastopirellula retiformator TaxID=2527970 RepID=A0A5C5V1R4_9BACT|nr:2-phosphosulfolactate phosphatase [Blastopirellula retiformator]TWT31727.1 putative 2-phosphosulfolactate phosphatase [Blastopirellula retiformator]